MKKKRANKEVLTVDAGERLTKALTSLRRALSAPRLTKDLERSVSLVQRTTMESLGYRLHSVVDGRAKWRTTMGAYAHEQVFHVDLAVDVPTAHSTIVTQARDELIEHTCKFLTDGTRFTVVKSFNLKTGEPCSVDETSAEIP